MPERRARPRRAARPAPGEFFRRRRRAASWTHLREKRRQPSLAALIVHTRRAKRDVHDGRGFLDREVVIEHELEHFALPARERTQRAARAVAALAVDRVRAGKRRRLAPGIAPGLSAAYHRAQAVANGRR